MTCTGLSHHVARSVVFVALTLFAGCKSDVAGIGGGGGGADAGGSSVTAININLPDRSGMKAAVPDIETKMNGYHLVITPVEPASCQTPTRVDELAAYGVKPTLSASLKQGCDYDVTLELGNKAADGGQTGQTGQAGQTGQTGQAAAKVTYEGRIKTVLNACTDCHDGGTPPNLVGYAAAKSRAARIQARMNDSARPMPPSGLLAQAERDAVKAWIDAGALEKDEVVAPPTTTLPPSVGAKKLAATYYKNATPLRVKKEDIAGKAEFAVTLKLQLQDAGRAIGLGSGTSVNSPGASVITPPPPGASGLSAARDIKLLPAAGAEQTLSQLIKGQYMLLMLADSSVAGAVTKGTELNADAALQALLSNAKCNVVVIVPPTDLTAWQTATGGTGAFIGKNSYSQVDTATFTQIATAFGETYTATPAYMFVDKAGNRAEASATPVDTAVFPDAAIRKFCAP